MIYESKIIFAFLSDYFEVIDGKEWCDAFASFKMGKIGGKPKCFNKETKHFFYNNDKHLVFFDDYKESLTECTFKEFFNWINQDNEKLKKETKFDISINPKFRGLKGYTNSLNESYDSKKIIVLHFGY